MSRKNTQLNFSFTQQPLFIYLFLGCFLLLYIFSLRAYYVGFFNDDAFHIIGANALLQGKYIELNQPTLPPLVHYTPGYPLLITPIALLFGYSTLPYQLFSIAMVLLGIFILWTLFKKNVSGIILFSVLLLASVNPLTVSLSGTALSDIALFLFIPVVFYFVSNRWTKKKFKDWAPIIIFSSFAFYIRPIGGIFPLVIFCSLAFEKRWKLAGIVLLGSACLISPYLIRNMMVGGQVLPLAKEFGSAYEVQSPISIVLSLIINNSRYYLNEFFIRSLYRWPGFSIQPLFILITCALGIVCVYKGVQEFGFKSWKKVLVFSILGYFAVLLIWSRHTGRYLFPILPFLYTFFFLGFYKIGKSFKNQDRSLIAGLVLSLLLTAFPLKAILSASMLKETPVNTPPMETYDWINTHTEPNALFAVSMDGRFFLYTKRQVLNIPNLDEKEKFDYWAEKYGVQYILNFPTDMVLPSQSQAKKHHPLATDKLSTFMSDPSRYLEVFRSSKDNSALYRVLNK